MVSRCCGWTCKKTENLAQRCFPLLALRLSS
uniref:Uncharacterized protein n=1 Tax=Rhizophora mucronata TaxID=61149 RepID=A0A2P2PGF2_RHIMU